MRGKFSIVILKKRGIVVFFMEKNVSRLIETLMDKDYRGKTLGWVRNNGLVNDAENLYQDLWVKALDRCKKYDPGRPPEIYLNQIMRNLIFDKFRKNGRRKTEINESDILEEACLFDFIRGDCDDPSGHMEMVDKINTTWRVLGDIPEKYSSLLKSHYLEEMTYEDISEMDDIPIGTVKSRLHRARAIFEKSAKDMGVEYEFST